MVEVGQHLPFFFQHRGCVLKPILRAVQPLVRSLGHSAARRWRGLLGGLGAVVKADLVRLSRSKGLPTEEKTVAELKELLLEHELKKIDKIPPTPQETVPEGMKPVSVTLSSSQCGSERFSAVRFSCVFTFPRVKFTFPLTPQKTGFFWFRTF